MSQIELNRRFVLESDDRFRAEPSYNIVDLFKSETIGSFWRSGEVWNAGIDPTVEGGWKVNLFGTSRDAMVTLLRRKLPVRARR